MANRARHDAITDANLSARPSSHSVVRESLRTLARSLLGRFQSCAPYLFPGNIIVAKADFRRFERADEFIPCRLGGRAQPLRDHSGRNPFFFAERFDEIALVHFNLAIDLRYDLSFHARAGQEHAQGRLTTAKFNLQ